MTIFLPLNETALILIFTPEYKRNLRDLAKQYQNIRSNTLLIITEIQKGNFIGERISGLAKETYNIFSTHLFR